MGVFARKTLRQNLGTTWVHDTYVGTTVGSVGANGSVYILDRNLANPAFSGEPYYERAWLRVASVDYRVATANQASGALLSWQAAQNAIASGMDYELSTAISPTDKDRCLDDVVKRFRLRQEVGLPSVDGALVYAIDGAASPNTIVEVMGAWYWSDPTGSLDRVRRDFAWFDVQQTATGMELRIDPAANASTQVVLDAILTVTLGSGDAATVNIPDERMTMAGAAAKAYDLLMAQTPGQVSDTYRQRRSDMAREFSRLAALNKKPISRKIELDEPFSKQRIGWFWE